MPREALKESFKGPLLRLARQYGVQTAYYDVAHRQRQAAGVESLLAVLQALGAPMAALEDAPAAERRRRQDYWQRPLDPVTVAWDAGGSGAALVQVAVRLPQSLAGLPLSGRLRLEEGVEGEAVGSSLEWHWKAGDAPVTEAADVEGQRYVVKRLISPVPVPQGCHRFTLDLPGGPAESRLVVSPITCYQGGEAWPDVASPKGGSRGGPPTWGVFLPLYALHTQRSWGSGDFSDLEALVTWTAGLGGGMVGTLPLLAAFLDRPLEPSPYAPVSRLFFNEFFLDAARAPEMADCPAARQVIASQTFQQELDGLRRAGLVDYRRGMALKRRVLEELARTCFASPARMAELRTFLGAHPLVEDYARFRAAAERMGSTWRSWPPGLQQGRISPGDFDEGARRYHVYVQWLAHQQVEALAEAAGKKGQGLYLDLPLGVHAGGYDTWKYRRLFLNGLSAGAPPDAVCPKGQDWGFPPGNPETQREQGYDYFRGCLRHHMQAAGILRIDHVMGLHRLFCIPQGMTPAQGVYLRYPAEEHYAVLALESRRHRTVIVGEDLGTVPAEVTRSMRRHGVHKMYVAYFQFRVAKGPGPQSRPPLRPVPADSLASVNTHDMAPFAAFWQGLDIDDRRTLGQISEAAAGRDTADRRALIASMVGYLRGSGQEPHAPAGAGALPAGGDAAPSAYAPAALRAILAFLAASPARMALVNLEDLWLETKPQNVPATSLERPNWRRKARYSLEEFSRLPEVVEALQAVDRLRRSAGLG
jgi:4-alpha-glucanotransferase